MKLFRHVWFMLLISSFVLGQSTPGNTKPDDNRIADQIKTLQDAIASQQQQIESLRQELASRKQAEAAPRLTNAALTTGSACCRGCPGNGKAQGIAALLPYRRHRLYSRRVCGLHQRLPLHQHRSRHFHGLWRVFRSALRRMPI